MRWLLALMTLTLVTYLSDQKRDTDDSVTKCWNEYCKYPGLLTKTCPKRGEINTCRINSDETEIKCERMYARAPEPDKTCKNDFMNECSCGYTNKVDSPEETESTAFCDCKMKSSAKTTIGLIVGFVVLIAGCGVCLGKWFVVKRETVQFQIRERDEQSKFDTYGDYSANSQGGTHSQSQGQRNSAHTQGGTHSQSQGQRNSAHTQGGTHSQSQGQRNSAHTQGGTHSQSQGQRNSAHTQGGTHSQSQGQRNSAHITQGEKKTSLSAGPRHQQPIASPGGRSVSQNPGAGRGMRGPASPHSGAGRGMRGPASPHSGAGRGVRGPVSPHPGAGRGVRGPASPHPGAGRGVRGPASPHPGAGRGRISQ